MPLYEYRCTACGHRFEKIQSFSAPDEKDCPKCGAPVERLISAPAIQFKGSGFYLTDYAKGGNSGKGTSDGESSGSGSKSDGSKSEGGKSDSAASSTKNVNSSTSSGGSAGTTPSSSSSSA